MNSTIRYNEDTDMVQILGSDNVWYDYRSGGLTEFDLVDSTRDDWSELNKQDLNYNSGTLTFNSGSNIKITATSNSSGNSNNTNLYNLNHIDLSGFNKVTVNADVRLYTTARARIQFVNLDTGLTDLSIESPTAPSTEANWDSTYDISSLEGKYKIWLWVYAYYNYGESYFNLKKLFFSK